MKQLDRLFLEKNCICLECGSSIDISTEKIVCKSCGTKYPFYKDIPVLISSKNKLFKPQYYDTVNSQTKEKSSKQNRNKIGYFIKKYLPSKSVNLSRDKIFKQLAKKYSQRSISVLVVGGGNQRNQIDRYFKSSGIKFVFCDIDKNANIDVFCDAHKLPFHNKCFDGLITTAVLEHVLYPEQVVDEMVRVLKPGGFVYSEIPFLQSVHEGAYDFTRYTMSGHRRLLEQFEEIDAGMVAGPATALVWVLCDFSKALFTSKLLSQLIVITTQYTLSWIKYFDFLMVNNSKALDFASCTYFLGIKASLPATPESIIEKYGKSNIVHV